MSTRRNRQANPWDEDEADEVSGPSGVRLVVGIGTVAIVPTLIVLAYLPPIGWQSEWSHGTFGQAVTFVVHFVFAVGLGAGALGLFLGKAWGWWGAVVFHAANVLYQGKMLFYYLDIIKWGHPKATGYGFQVGVRYALPVALTLALLVMLFFPSMRELYGVKDRAYRRRRVVGPGARDR